MQAAYSASAWSCSSKPRACATALLALLDLGVEELLDPAAVEAHQVVVVLALVELEHRLAGLEVVARQDAGLLELHQHAVDRGQADVGMPSASRRLKIVFGAHVALRWSSGRPRAP